MLDNTLDISSYTINPSNPDTTLLEQIVNILDTYDKIYSYILVYNKDKNLYKMKISVCSTDKYNTYPAQTVVEDICDTLIVYTVDKGSTVCFLQPDLSMQCEMFTPYAHKLAADEHMHWQHMETDDLVQMVYESIIKLYRRGYYLNKFLVRKTFLNSLYGTLRKYSPDKECSLYTPINKDGMRDITIADIVEDDTLKTRDAEETADALLTVIEDMRDTILQYISQRQYDQLLFEYGNKCVSMSSAKTVQQLRQRLKRDGFTKKYINKRYY